MHENNRHFAYTYSAKEQAEIKKIRARYETPQRTEVDKIERLRRLDASVTSKATMSSLITGFIGAMLLGFGMSLFMTDLSDLLHLNAVLAILLGLLTGMVGIALVALAYPIYLRVTKRERDRVAPEILKLTDELLK